MCLTTKVESCIIGGGGGGGVRLEGRLATVLSRMLPQKWKKK